MFSKVLVLALFATLAVALPVERNVIQIKSQDMDIDPEGRFKWSYESEDGTSVQQTGDIKQVDKDTVVGIIQGSFNYKAADGSVITLNYVADENGFQPQGAHLPVAPEMPAAIARAVAYLATAPPPKN